MNEYLLSLSREKYNGSTLRVAMYLLLRLSFKEERVINQVKIADDLKLERYQVNEAIKQLLSDDYLEKGIEKYGRHCMYRLVYQIPEAML